MLTNFLLSRSFFKLFDLSYTKNFCLRRQNYQEPIFVFVPLIPANFRIFGPSFSYLSLTDSKVRPAVQKFKDYQVILLSEKILENKNVEQIGLLGTKFQFQVSVYIFYLRGFIFGARSV